MNNIREELRQYVEKEILPQYDLNESAHGREEYVKYLQDLQEITSNKEKFVERSHKLMQNYLNNFSS